MSTLSRRLRAAGLMTVLLSAIFYAGSPFAAANAAGHDAQANEPSRTPVSHATGTAAPVAEKGESASGQATAPSPQKPLEVTELWTGALYTSTFRATLCFSSRGVVRGVVNLHLANGETDVYHIVGNIKNNEIEASHSSGHTFKGRLLSSDKVEGVISLKNGMRIKVDGKRHQDVPVTEDCAPLPH